MEKEFIKRYSFVQREVNRIQDSSPLSLIFIVWGYLSDNKGSYELPENLSLKHWANAYLHSSSKEHKLGQYFKEIEKALPDLQGAFSRLLNYSRTMAVTDATLFHYATLFREVLYMDLDSSAWKGIYRTAYETYIRRNNRFFIADPSDFSYLMSRVFSTLYRHHLQPVVYIPFLRAGDLAVAVNETTQGSAKIIAHEVNSEVFSFAILNSIIYDINTTEFGQASLLEGTRHPYNGMLSMLPLGGLEEMKVLDFISSQVLFQSEVSVVMVAQGVLFNRRYGFIRKRMIIDGHLRAVVSLAPNALHYTRVKMAMLVFEKRKTDADILFVNAENLDKDTRRAVKLSDEQVEKLTRIIQENSQIEGLSRLVSIDQLKAQDFMINVTAMIPERSELPVDPAETWRQIQENQQKIENYENILQKSFSKLKSLLNK